MLGKGKNFSTTDITIHDKVDVFDRKLKAEVVLHMKVPMALEGCLGFCTKYRELVKRSDRKLRQDKHAIQIICKGIKPGRLRLKMRAKIDESR